MDRSFKIEVENLFKRKLKKGEIENFSTKGPGFTENASEMYIWGIDTNGDLTCVYLNKDDGEYYGEYLDAFDADSSVLNKLCRDLGME